MKRTLKTIIALLLCAVLAAGLASCGVIGNFYEVAGSIDGTDISAGLYLMAQFSAYSEATGLVEDAEADVLKQEVEGVKAKTWIQDRTVELLRRYVRVQRLARELKVSLSETGSQNVQSMMQYWEYMQEMYAENGISQNTVLRYNTNDELRRELFQKLYAEGGELAVPDEQLKAEYAEEYAFIRFFSVPTSKLDDDSTDMTAEVEELTTAMVEKLNGGATLDAVADSDGPAVYELLEREASSAVTAESITTTYINLHPESFDTYSEAFLSELAAQQPGAYGSYNMGSTVIVYEKQAMFTDDEEFQNMRNTVITNLKTEDFNEWLAASYADYEADWRFGARAYLGVGNIEY